MDLSFYRGKKVLITGHTGFKGSWMCRVLYNLGAKVTGYALAPEKDSLYEILGLDDYVDSKIGDIRDCAKLKAVVDEVKPEIVIHMAAQPLVKHSYEFPRETFEINVMGTVNILDAIRQQNCVRSFVNVTTDKVYMNVENQKGYVETDRLCGYDPYSNSKSCSELVTYSYVKSFLQHTVCAVSTCRAGNVIGGGDFAKDRIIPDCVKASINGQPIGVRNPLSVRPFQHVLEPVVAYLLVAKEQYENPEVAGEYNIGPGEESCVTTEKLVTLFCRYWDRAFWECTRDAKAVHEANFLKLDSSKIKQVLGIENIWGIEKTVEKTVEWYRAYYDKKDMVFITDSQIGEYYKEFTRKNLHVNSEKFVEKIDKKIYNGTKVSDKDTDI